MDALHKWCKKHKGRQKALAAELGVTEQVLSHWLCRRKMPSFAFGLRLQAYARERGIVTEEANLTSGLATGVTASVSASGDR